LLKIINKATLLSASTNPRVDDVWAVIARFHTYSQQGERFQQVLEARLIYPKDKQCCHQVINEHIPIMDRVR
jgi:hypothetical protein